MSARRLFHKLANLRKRISPAGFWTTLIGLALILIADLAGLASLGPWAGGVLWLVFFAMFLLIPGPAPRAVPGHSTT